MKMFMEEFKVLDMSELIAVNGGDGTSLGYGTGSYGASYYGSNTENGFSISGNGISYTSGNVTISAYGTTSGSYSSETGNGISFSHGYGSLLSASISTGLGTFNGSLDSVTVGVKIRY